MSIVESIFKESRHFLSCYDDKENITYALENLREITKYLISQGYGVIYGAEEFQEDDTHTQDLLVRNIINAKDILDGSTQNVDTNELISDFKRRLLLINPYSVRYSHHNSLEIVDHWLSQYSNAETFFAKNNFKPARIIGISHPYPFYEKNEYDEFLGFEQKIERAFGDKLGLICWYKKKWLENSTLPQFIKILNTHGSIIYNDLKTTTWDSSKLIEIITETIDAVANEEDKRSIDLTVSTLLFATIKHAYHLDKKSLISKPDRLEQVLIKMLGKQSYKEIEKRIKTELIERIFESSTSTSFKEKRNGNNVPKL